MAKKANLAPTPLSATVEQDIQTFMSGLNRIFTCEADFQLELADYLRSTKHYQNVFLEYFVPNIKIAGNTANAYIDIVVENDDEYVPIELKFKTKSLKVPVSGYSCFGRPTRHSLVSYMKGHTDNRYLVWEDVKRIDLIKTRYGQTVKHGFVVFLTNDSAYQKQVNNYSLHTCQNYTPGDYHTRKPQLGLTKTYNITWHSSSGNTINGQSPQPSFDYTIIEV
mgnify:FL=1